MNSRKMAVSVFGLGYVGCVSAACFAARGHRVVGVDANPAKTQFIRDGVAPIVEDRIGELTKQVVADGFLTVADDPTSAVLESDISLICVGTPSASTGALSTEHVERVSAEVGAALAIKDASLAFAIVADHKGELLGEFIGLIRKALEVFESNRIDVHGCLLARIHTTCV